MEKDIEDFIDNRINNNYNYLTKTKKWQNTIKEFNSVYEKLYKELSEEQQEKLEKIIDIKNTLISYEDNFVYQLAKNDTITLLKVNFIL